MVFHNYALRKIRFGKTELIRSIYFAFRDQNWQNIPYDITFYSLQDKDDSFSILLKARAGKENNLGTFEVEITGDRQPAIDFCFSFTAEKNFLKNRIGLCIHLPLEETLNRNFNNINSLGESIQGIFPEHIEPFQPITDIRILNWNTRDHVSVSLKTEGDVFEMEDQRNWTDASFKIYSTPLAQPFPVEMKAGSVTEQRVRASFSLKERISAYSDFNKPILLNPSGVFCSMPATGFCYTAEQGQDLNTSEALSKLGFEHIRIDIDPENKETHAVLSDAYRFCSEHNLKLDIAFHSGNSRDFPGELIQIIRNNSGLTNRCMVFDRKTYNSSGENITSLTGHLKKALDGIRIGGGSYANFAELNRNRSLNSDFIVIAANPEVHAEDELTVIENLEGLRYVIQTAKHLFPGIPVSIAPLSMKPRFNAVATDKQANQTIETDPRQRSLFGALWLLGSYKRIAESGGASLTIPEFTGRNGCVMDQKGHYYYPFHALTFIPHRSSQGIEIEICRSSRPEEAEALMFRTNAGSRELVLLNYSPGTREIILEKPYIPLEIKGVLSEGKNNIASLSSRGLIEVKGPCILKIRCGYG